MSELRTLDLDLLAPKRMVQIQKPTPLVDLNATKVVAEKVPSGRRPMGQGRDARRSVVVVGTGRHRDFAKRARLLGLAQELGGTG